MRRQRPYALVQHVDHHAFGIRRQGAGKQLHQHERRAQIGLQMQVPRSARGIVPLIALAYVFQGLYYQFQTGILIQKKTSYMGIIGGVAAIANVALNLLLIPSYQGMGAAWATTLSFLLLALLAYNFSQRTYWVPYKVVKFFVPLLLGMATYFISTLITAPTAVLSIVLKLLLVPAFLAGVYLTGFLDKDDVTKVKSFFRARLARYGWGTAVLPEG